MQERDVKTKHRKLKLIIQFFTGAKRYFAAAIAASFLMTALNSLTPQIFRFTIDGVLGGGGYPYLSKHLWAIALVLIAVELLSGIAMFICKYDTAKAGENFAQNLRNTLFTHVQKLPMSWHDKNQTGDIIQRCTSDVEVIRNFVVTQLLEVFRTTFLVVVSFAVMLSMNVKLSLIVLLFVPVVVIYSSVFYRMIAKRFQYADEAEGELSTVVQENATGVRVVRAFGREKFEMDRFREKNDIFAKLWIRLGTLSGLYWGVGDLITGLQVVTVIVLGAVEAVHGNITVGEFVAFASYNTTLVWPIRGLGRILSDMSKAGVSFERVDYILGASEEAYREEDAKQSVQRQVESGKVSGGQLVQRQVESGEVSGGQSVQRQSKRDRTSGEQSVQRSGASDAASAAQGASHRNSSGEASENQFAGDIVFSHVDFGYEGGQQVLSDIDFTIPKGTTFGILGGTGSGKSTIVQLLTRLYELGADGGSIRIGGRDIRDIPLEELRQNIGFVLQEPFLYSRTIRENIAASRPDATMEEIWQAARTACVDDAIMGFADGYDTLVGERGVTLSGGQRQRVAIARMLLQKAPIMVFDDSLSAVDSETDSLIRKALKERMKDATVILISHRITTLMGASNILVLSGGRIAQLGTHHELIEKDGIYRRIYEIQMSHDDRREVAQENGSL